MSPVSSQDFLTYHIHPTLCSKIAHSTRYYSQVLTFFFTRSKSNSNLRKYRGVSAYSYRWKRYRHVSTNLRFDFISFSYSKMLTCYNWKQMWHHQMWINLWMGTTVTPVLRVSLKYTLTLSHHNFIVNDHNMKY